MRSTYMEIRSTTKRLRPVPFYCAIIKPMAFGAPPGRIALDASLSKLRFDGIGSMSVSTVAPTIVSDPRAAIDWLVEVLGFRISALYDGPDGGVAFAQLVWRNGVVFVSAHSTQQPWTNVGLASICLVAEDAHAVRQHYNRAAAAGAAFIRPLHINKSPAFPDGVSEFDLRDPEGHFWTVSNFQPE